MKATEFCQFFDFDITAQSPSDNEEVTHRYAVVDNNGTFSTRYIDSVDELTDQFDTMLYDYVDSTLLDYGFMPDDKSDKGFYSQALDFIENGDGEDLKGTDTHKVIKCLTDASLIEDDVAVTV